MNNVHAATVSTLVSARSHVGLVASSLCGLMLARAPGIRQAIAIATLLGGTAFSHSVYADCLTIPNPPAPTPSSGGPTLLAGGSYIVRGFGGNVYANTGESTISNSFVSGAGFSHTVGNCVYPAQTVGLGFYTTLGGAERATLLY